MGQVLHHVAGCVCDDKVCWIDRDDVEWHRGFSVGVYRVRDVPQRVCDFICEDRVTDYTANEFLWRKN